MDENEARKLIDDRLMQVRQLSDHQLRGLERERCEVVADSGTTYQIVTYVLEDDAKRGHLRVTGAADDFGWRAFAPLVGDFIVAPDGSFIGE